MNADTPAVAPDVRSLVTAEVERQVKALREEVEAKIAEVRERTVDDAATIVVFSSDLDKVKAAPGDRYGDVHVDTSNARRACRLPGPPLGV